MCPMNWLKKRERFWTTRNKKGMKVMRPELWSFLPLWIGWKKKDKSFFLPSILQKWGKENREGQVIGWAWPSLLVGGESSSNNTWNTCLIRSNFLQLPPQVMRRFFPVLIPFRRWCSCWRSAHIHIKQAKLEFFFVKWQVHKKSPYLMERTSEQFHKHIPCNQSIHHALRFMSLSTFLSCFLFFPIVWRWR